MPRIAIDSRDVEVAPGETILDAAARLGIHIPTLCHVRGRRPQTSCFVCVVKVKGRGGLAPACATVAMDGMVVESDAPEVHEARRTALELLLSDHLGDCLAPCHLACPAIMNIPLMIRQIAAGELRAAVGTVKKDIALPAVLGRICPAPCEKACRRGDYDAPLAICLLKRYAADADLALPDPYLPHRQPPKAAKVAIVGAGPAGLATAYYLLQEGYPCTVFDDHEKPGGMLRYGVPEERLPREVLDSEIRVIERLGAEFRMGTAVGCGISFEHLRHDFAAVVVTTGAAESGLPNPLGLSTSAQGIEINRATLETTTHGVFAGGDAVRASRMAVRSVADGKLMAASVRQYLSGVPVAGLPRPFSTHVGRLTEAERPVFMGRTNPGPRVAPGGPAGGFTPEEAQRESLRCLHCDCLRQNDCRLRDCSDAYHARSQHYKSTRRAFERVDDHHAVVYEPGKCIACGLCVQITEDAKEPLGLTFVGRGFDVRVRTPFDQGLSEALVRVAAECVAACPTGALALKEGGEHHGV